MPIQLDHVIVPSRDRIASARLIAELLGVAWAAECDVGPFSPVYVNEELTLDFAQMDPSFTPGHFAFRVGTDDFDAILDRKQRGEALSI